MAEPVALTTTVLDQAGKTATFSEFFADTLTVAQIEEGVLLHAPKIDGILSGIINRMEFCVAVDLSGLTGNTVGSTADVEEVGEFIFLTDANRRVSLNVPCINDTASVVGSDDLDQTDSDVDALIDAMIDGLTVTGGNLQPCDADEADITAVKSARERVRNSGSRGA